MIKKCVCNICSDINVRLAISRLKVLSNPGFSVMDAVQICNDVTAKPVRQITQNTKSESSTNECNPNFSGEMCRSDEILKFRGRKYSISFQ